MDINYPSVAFFRDTVPFDVSEASGITKAVTILFLSSEENGSLTFREEKALQHYRLAPYISLLNI